MKSICAVEGVTAAGIREGKFGLALIRASGTAAGVFTSNKVRAAPVEVMMERIERGALDAVVVNSGCANAYTGERGYRDAVEMCEIAAGALNLAPGSVGVASTGVIGRYLDLPLIRDQCGRAAPLLARSADAEDAAAKAIMTTDTFPKHALFETETFSVGGITKGSGMIAPNMGTMLAFIYTDAEVEAPVLRDILQQATRRSFNRVVVDGDTSTNDVSLCTATGAAGRVDRAELARAVEVVCRDLAVQIARDGEGATKLLEVTVRGAPDEDAAAAVARTVVASPLVKTAVYGEDPNWGRVVAAAGRAGVEFDPYAVSLRVGEIPLVLRGEIVADLGAAKAAMRGATVAFDLDLAAGDGKATAWGCDLTEKYVEINGKYTT
ncbi:bifunctional glutamate N-acetyltransferase/amino-acid acetyltransferase ArgJ [Methanoculleus sp. MH98A]|uniref:bifunctional glutamate N-acetyltransferase/amino-acid acetyltransferase ArgJ n=1 Tax=Methanoculleus sp. MH98A TaxID=1495314 RepID=UPI00049F3751|nr:bifunctional glutamate N-acetyltransferase/amino-acid acetyltransferase ArgJ [Methanoculleus sp. MH98A]KDE55697.1 ornithine acetyltransferase [Methanoculleus sp. MH98A]